MQDTSAVLAGQSSVAISALRWHGAAREQCRSIWDRLCDVNPELPVFAHPQWFALACEARAASPCRIVTITGDERPLGLFPLQRTTPWTIRHTDPMTLGATPPVVDPPHAEAAWRGLFSWFRASRFALLHLGDATDPALIEMLTAIASDLKLVVAAQATTPIIVLPLPASYEAYLGGLRKSARGNLRRAERQLHEDYPDSHLELLTSPAHAERAIDTLMEFYRRRWGNQVGGSVFHDPRQCRFFQQAMMWVLQRGWGVVARLSISSHPVALATLLHIPGQSTAYYHYAVRDLDALPQRYSPGLVVLDHLIRRAIERGAAALQMGAGNAYYKTLVGGEEVPRSTITVARSAFTAAVLPHFNRLLHLAVRSPQHLAYLLHSMTKRNRER
jgi:CelD/BcsL family acetyltransferase involved in cellulose biosynthesis